MPFDFDPGKDAKNRKRHGMSLALADKFDFDNALIMEDDREQYGEQRFFAIGPLSDGTIVALVYTYRDDEVRPISIRKAEPRESRRWSRQLRT